MPCTFCGRYVTAPEWQCLNYAQPKEYHIFTTEDDQGRRWICECKPTCWGARLLDRLKMAEWVCSEDERLDWKVMEATILREARRRKREQVLLGLADITQTVDERGEEEEKEDSDLETPITEEETEEDWDEVEEERWEWIKKFACACV